MPPPKIASAPKSTRGKASTSSVSLKSLAARLQLSPATVSLVINRSPAAKSIPQRTQERIRAVARELNYRPNFMARSLRAQRSFTIGVVVPEISDGYAALVMSGIEDYLLQEGYFYFVVSHRHRSDLVEGYPRLLQERAVEGLIAVDTACQQGVPIPVVAVSGHREMPGVTNIVLNHDRAARLALEHLANLGHQKIAFIKGQGIPRACLHEGIDEEEFLIFRRDDETGIVRAACVPADVDRPFRHRKKGVRLAQVWSHRAAAQTTAYALQIINGIGGLPQHQVAV